MMVSLTIRHWKATAVDRDVASKAEADHDADNGTMTVIKKLAPKHMIADIGHCVTLGRAEHYKLTVPGLVVGQRLLATALFETYAMTHRTIKDEYERRVENFLDVYPRLIKEAPDRLGGSFKATDFPAVGVIRSLFEYTYKFSPVPDGKDWRLEGIGLEDVESLRGEIEDSVGNMYRTATEAIYERAKTVLGDLARQAENYSLDAPGAMLRDATIENMREIANLVCSMNVTNDPTLDKVGKEMVKQFETMDGAELRKSAERRVDVASKAHALLNKLKAGRK